MIKPNRTIARTGLLGLLVASTCFAAPDPARHGQMTPREIIEFNARAHAEAGHKWCGTEAVSEALKFDLFRQAAKVRGRDPAWFERAARSSVLRLNHPLVVSGQKVGLLYRCTAAASLKLGRGYTVRGGHRTLSAQIGYNADFNATNAFNYENDYAKHETHFPGLVATATDADEIVTRLAALSPERKTSRRPR